jgi:XTP/dITP diphosphohydrolase
MIYIFELTNQIYRQEGDLAHTSYHARSIVEEPVTLVIATGNQGKIAEITALLDGFPVNIKNLSDFGPIPPVIEDGETFDDNAYKKASQTARVLGLSTLADDSGLLVDALEGAPGVYSARWGGEHLTDIERSQLLLKEMADHTLRKAAFQCVISIAVPSGLALTYEARCEGEIARKPAGENGFGYDPVFYFPSMNKTFAQLTRDEKSRVSHRGKALREVRDEFDKVLIWIRRHMPVPEKIGCAMSRNP